MQDILCFVHVGSCLHKRGDASELCIRPIAAPVDDEPLENRVTVLFVRIGALRDRPTESMQITVVRRS